MTESFIELCVKDKISIDKIDDYIDIWHDENKDIIMTLPEFLGMTQMEYTYWVINSSNLKLIIYFRKELKKLEDELKKIKGEYNYLKRAIS